MLLVAAVVSTCIVDEISRFTEFESGQVSMVAVVMVEFVLVLGAHSWVRACASTQSGKTTPCLLVDCSCIELMFSLLLTWKTVCS